MVTQHSILSMNFFSTYSAAKRHNIAFYEHQMLAPKKSNPNVANTAPANISIQYSIRIASLPFLVTIVSEAALPDIAIITTIDMVRAMPIEIVIPNIIPKVIKLSMDNKTDPVADNKTDPPPGT